MFCMKCGNQIPEGTKFCIRCGHPVPENTVVENPAAPETPVAPVAPVPEDVVVQEKPAAVKSVIGEIGKKLESAKPVLDKMGEKLESAKPIINKMGEKVGEKLESARPMLDKMGEKLESEPMIGKIEEKLNIKPGKKKLPIIIGGVAALLVLVVLLRSGGGNGPGSGFGSPEEAFDAWMTGFCQQDFDLTIRAEPDFVIEHEGGETALREKLQRNHNNDVAPRAAKGFIKFEATGHTMLGQDKVEKFVETVKSVYGVDPKISAVATIQQRSVWIDDTTTAGTSGYAFKCEGKWYYLNSDLFL